MKKMYAFAMLFFCIAVSSFAQVTTSNIRGLVVDDQNEPLPGATVIAVHTPTGTKYGVSTNLDGRYNILNARVGGPYTVTVTFVGFQAQEFKNISLALGKTFSLDVKMAADSQALDEVVINATGGNNVFGNDRTGQQTNVGKRELATLPTISRSQADFTRLEPSASGGSFGGRNDQFNNFSLDGAIFNNPFGLDAPTPGGQTGAQPISLDAIDQISVSLAPYDVTQSGFTGASVNAVTKSGTNEFHGTLYGYYRNQDFTGGKIKGEKVTKPDLNQKQYGFSFGGPIVKDKLFFFVNFEKNDRDDLGTNGWIPNTNSGAINESRVSRQDLIDVQNALTNLGYNPGRFEGFTYAQNSTKGIFKLDWNVNDNNRLAVIYNFLNASKEKPAHPTAIGVRGPSFATLQFENSGYEINNKLNSIQVELNSTLNENMTNKLQVGYSHFDDFRNPLSVPAPVINIQDGNGSNYIIAGHEPFSINNKLDQKVTQLTNNLNIFNGNHTYTVGFSFEKFAFKNSFNLAAYDRFAYPYRGTFTIPGFGGPYPSVASFLADAADPNGVLATNLQYARDRFNAQSTAGTGTDGGWKLAELNVGQLSFYLQDEWNASEDFKLTYGVRVDKPLYFNTSKLIQKYIDTDNNATRNNTTLYFNPQTGKEVNLNSTVLPNNDWLISPRLGFNYDVTGDDTTQLRGGTGVFTGRFPFVWLGNQVSGADDGFFQIVDPSYQWPQVWRSNLGIDHRFKNGIIATADFSYTKDFNGAHVQNWGLRKPTSNLVTPNSNDDRVIYSGADKGNNAYVFSNSDKGRIFNASLKLQKRFENGLYTSVAYNYLNAKDVNSIEAEITGDAFAGNPVVGNANTDVLSYSKYGDTHRVIAVASKKFSYANDKMSTTLSLFGEYAQGGRFNYTYAGDINNDGSSINDLLYVPTASEVQQMQFSGAGQAEAFEAYIQQDEYLNSNRGGYMERYGALAPWRGKWDMKFIQEFKVSKDNSIQFSADILNIGNLINSEWGVIQQANNINPLSVNFPDADPDPNKFVPDYTKEPIYTFNPELKNTFGFDSSLASRWQVQLGLRYIF